MRGVAKLSTSTVGRAEVFLLALLSAHSTFVKYADLWIRRQPESDQ